MARIQILELPDEEGPDSHLVTRFALILDQLEGGVAGPVNQTGSFAGFARECGARASLVTEDTIDLPDQATAQIGAVSVKVEPDLTAFEEGVRASIERAQAAIVDAVKGPEFDVLVGGKRIDEPHPRSNRS